MPSTDRVLAPGVTESSLRDAILRSGYPLQASAVDIVVGALTDGATGSETSGTRVQEEWSFIDDDEGKVRTLDALINYELPLPRLNSLGGIPESASGTMKHFLDLLIECKRAELPFVFFLRDTSAGQMPRVLGLPYGDLSIEATGKDGAPFRFRMTAHSAFRLAKFDCGRELPTAIAMRRTIRNGKKIELSGDEVFRELTLPMAKAQSYYSEEVVGKARPEALYHNVHYVCMVVVLRAPMVGVTTLESVQIRQLPWARLVRIDPGGDQDWPQSVVRVIDVVHIDSLAEYVKRAKECAMSAAKLLNTRAICLLTGKAKTSTLGEAGNAEDFPDPEPLISEKEFLNAWNERFQEIHARSEDQQPMMRVERLN